MTHEECPVCYEHLGDVEALECGHRIHVACLEKHFRAECPVCRTPQTKVKPKGKMPRSSAGRSVRYVNPASANEKITIIICGKYAEEDKKYVEDVLTRKHRGEVLNKHDNEAYFACMMRLSSFSIKVEKI